jgi:hypothetical protein
MFIPHQPEPTMAVRNFFVRASAPKIGLADKARLATLVFFKNWRRVKFMALLLNRFISQGDFCHATESVNLGDSGFKRGDSASLRVGHCQSRESAAREPDKRFMARGTKAPRHRVRFRIPL